MLDSDLAELYGVLVWRLNEQVKRNKERFPEDFVFQLTKEEYKSLTSQIASLKRGQHRKYLPYVFTEHGAFMLSSVLRSKRAIQVSIAVVNAFIKMREYLATHRQIAEKIEKLEKKLLEHDKHLITLYELINRLLEKPKEPQKPKQIGFRPQK